MTTTVKPPLELEQYLETMSHWIRVSCRRSVRSAGALISREDMEAEARFALVEVWTKPPRGAAPGAPPKYQHLIDAGDLDQLQRIGRRAIFWHTGNIYYNDVGGESPRCGRCENCKPRCGRCSRIIEARDRGERVAAPKREACGDCAKKFRRPCKALAVASIEDHVNTAGLGDPLGRLLAGEALERAVEQSDEARVLVMEVMDRSDSAPAPRLDAGDIFLERRVRNIVLHELHGIATVKRHDRKERHMTTTLETPDVQTATTPETPKPKATKAKALKAKAPKAQKAAQSAATTKAASHAFAKDQKVAYAGGGRAKWLATGSHMTVLGHVTSRGRVYVRCLVTASKKKISLSSALLKKV